MPQTFLVFDFETSEEAAQQARHRLEGWKQAFHLDKKLLFKFERSDAGPEESEERGKGKRKSKPEKKEDASGEAAGKVRLIVRLDFSDYEKLSHQRWAERLPMEEPFKAASPQIIARSDERFGATADLFDSLD